MLRARPRYPLPLFLIFGFIIGATIVFLILAPRVVQVQPDPGGALSTTGAIQLRFNRKVQADSALSRLSLNPAVDVAVEWQDEVLTIRPNTTWPTGEQLELRLGAGVRSNILLPSLLPQRWTFEVAEPRVAYLWPTDGKAEIYLREIGGEDELQLTDTGNGVLDFNISDDGSRIVYTALLPDGGTELRSLSMSTETEELLLECREQVRCAAPVLSPDGKWLAFEQIEYEQGLGGKPVPVGQSIYVMSLEPSGDGFLVSDPTHQSSNPSWSPDGLLEFYDNQIKATVIQAISEPTISTVEDYVPNSLGQPLAWHPQGYSVIYAEIVFPEEVLGSEGAGAIAIPEGESSFFSHLYRSDLTTGVVSDISPGTDPMVEDSSPIYSPDGKSVAFLRRYLDSARWTLGRQVWVMTSDGLQAETITESPDHNHSALEWSPDARRILWMRGPSGYPSGSDTTIHWYDVQTGDSGQIVEGGYLPQWIP